MFTVVVDRPGGRAVELTPVAESVVFATAAVGGFGDASFTVEGLHTKTLRHLATVRIMYGTAVVWEGRIEDPKLTITKDSIQTSVTCFGWQRLLSDNTVREAWSGRDISWKLVLAATTGPQAWDMTTGQIDPTDLTRKGVRFTSRQGVNMLGNVYAYWYPPSNLVVGRLKCDYSESGGNTGSFGGYMDDGSANSDSRAGAGALQVTESPGIGPGQWRLAPTSTGIWTGAGNDFADFTNIRFITGQTDEDAAGGFYGGTILRALIALCPGLTQGVIEDGSDFTIAAVTRAVRDSALSVVQEVAGYYTREWAVWDAGRFDWRTPNLNEAQWVVNALDCDELEIETSVDTLTRTSYVLYSDAVTGGDAEASAAATSQRNPFVRTGAAKDVTTQAGFPMTANTSAQLAAQLAAAKGQYPPVTGRVVLPAARLVANAVGSTQPAALIRAGSNILIPDLPKTDVFMQGRDGETLFHIAATEVNMETGQITLELEGQGRELDVITARLASATRVLTG